MGSGAAVGGGRRAEIGGLDDEERVGAVAARAPEHRRQESRGAFEKLRIRTPVRQTCATDAPCPRLFYSLLFVCIVVVVVVVVRFGMAHCSLFRVLVESEKDLLSMKKRMHFSSEYDAMRTISA